MTPRERAEMVRGAARLLPKTVARNGLRIEFDAEPALITNKAGATVGVDAMVRMFRGATELQVDPHRICINPPTMVPDGTFRNTPDGPVSNFREDPVEAYLTWLVESLQDAPNAKGWRTKGTVTTVYADAADGKISSSNATYSTARSGSSLSADATDTSNTVGQVTGFDVYEAFESFDTSTIPDSDSISAAELALSSTSDGSTTNFVLQARTHNWGATLTTADWVAGASLGALTLLATYDTASGFGAGYRTFTENGTNLQAAISKTGFTYIIINSSRHEAGNEPTNNEFVVFYSANQSGTTSDPKLTITHAGAAAGYSFGVAIG